MDNSFEISNLKPDKPAFAFNRFLKWLVVLALIIAAIGVSFFLFNHSTFSPSKVELKINVPEEVSSGEKVNYQITYSNHNEKGIKDLQLTFFYPSDAVDVRNGQLISLQTENIKLDNLNPGEEKMVEFSAYLVGGRGDVKKARAVLSFYGEGVPSVFKKEATVLSNIISLAVSLTLVAPPNAVAGQDVTYILDYRNESQEDLSDLRFQFSYPDGFVPGQLPSQSVTPFLSSRKIFDLKSLKAGKGDRISIPGILQGKERDGKTISVILQRKVDEIYIDFEKSSANTVISTPPITVQVLVNDKADYQAQLGDELEYQVKFTNNTDVDIFGLMISAKLEGSMLDLNTIRGNGFFDSTARAVVWNASVSPLLNHLAPRQEGAVSFRVKVKNSFSSGATGVKDAVIKVSAHIETPTIPPGFDLMKLAADAQLTTKIGSLPSLSQKGFRQDIVFGGSGPVPPRVGQKTTYTVSWEIINIPSDILKARVKGTLPAGVVWENQSRVNGQQPVLSFNSNSREVVWPLETIPAGTGGQFPKYQAWFMVSFTPSGNNIGQLIQLVKDAFLEGQDGFTKQNILVKVGDVTTNDLIDFPGSGNVQ